MAPWSHEWSNTMKGIAIYLGVKFEDSRSRCFTFDLSLFYKMADYCRPEEDNDVISCRIVEGFQIVYVLIFKRELLRSKNRVNATV